MSDPLVSIIMPAFNSARYIAEAIRSVLEQEHQNLELIIVNDGSTDNTENIVSSFLDPRIRYFSQQNKGVSSARNLALSKMQGDYFCFVDADDQLTNNSLNSRLKIFQMDPGVKFVDGVALSFNENVSRIKGEWKPTFSGYPLKELLMLKSTCFFGITWMIKADDNTSYSFDSSMDFAEDLWFYIGLVRAGGVYSYINEPVYLRREVKGSAMQNLKKMIDGYWALYQRISELQVLDNNELKHVRKKIRRILIRSSIRKLEFRFALEEFLRR